MAYTSADLSALQTARASGAKTVRLPNGEFITMESQTALDRLEARMLRDIRGTQLPSVHLTQFRRDV